MQFKRIFKKLSKLQFRGIATWLPEMGDMTEQTRDVMKQLESGNRTALARAITWVESTRPDIRHQSQLILQHLFSVRNSSRQTFRIGFTGPPGAGKSSFIEALGKYLQHKENRKMAVLAVDPSSAISGGSILGDKTRMTELARNPNAYVRPSPSAGGLGGVARNTNDSILLCEAAGYDTIFIETVGVGQSETTVADMVDMFVLITPPAAGDELQAIKRGIMEMADLILVNKADSDLEVPARRSLIEYISALKLLRPRTPFWRPQAMCVSSTTNKNIDEAWEKMLKYHETMRANGVLEQNRARQYKLWMWRHIEEFLLNEFKNNPNVVNALPTIEAKVTQGQLTPGLAADALCHAFSPKTLTKPCS